MREHQIIISLKSEQFEELQRMARTAGSNSLSAFARQKLLKALGISSSGKSRAPGTIDAPDLRHLSTELRKLHREVQVFVAESLAKGEYPLQAAPEVGSSAVRTVAENFLANGAPLSPISNYGSYDISVARPGAQLRKGGPSLPPYPRPAGQGQLPIPTYPNYPVPPPDPPLKPAQLPYDEPQAPPEKKSEQDKSDFQAFAEADDHLEELAERAFAISPRLGSLESPVIDQDAKPFPDPLQDLLESALFDQDEDTEEGMSEAQPDSESVSEELSSTDEKADAEQEAQDHEEQDQQVADQEIYEGEEEHEIQEDYEEEQQDAENEESQWQQARAASAKEKDVSTGSEKRRHPDEDDSEDDSDHDSDHNSDHNSDHEPDHDSSQGSDHRPLRPHNQPLPPYSGGPPPRKRQK